MKSGLYKILRRIEKDGASHTFNRSRGWHVIASAGETTLRPGEFSHRSYVLSRIHINGKKATRRCGELLQHLRGDEVGGSLATGAEDGVYAGKGIEITAHHVGHPDYSSMMRCE